MMAGFVTFVTFCHVLSRVTGGKSVTSVTPSLRGVTSVTTLTPTGSHCND